MKIGTLVRHIEHGYIGVAIQQGASTRDRWYIHWNDGAPHWWCSECELEVLCE